MICVYPADCTDFSTNGNGTLSPLTAVVTETLNGEYEVTLEHPIDESGKWTRIGAWWDRKGENELDIVAENELTGDHAVCEVKRNGERIDLAAVAEKFAAFQRATGEWRRVKPSFLALSMDDM